MNEFTIEHISLGMCDTRKIFEYFTSSNQEFIPALDERVNLEEYVEKIAKNADIFWIKNQEKVCGMCAIYFNIGIDAFITSINIRQEFQRKGCAQLLINRVINEAKRRDIKKIRLKVYQENSKAINFYDKVGFIKVENAEGWISMELRM